MYRSILSTSICTLWLFLASGLPVLPQEVPGEKGAKIKGIEGIWTQVYSETDGDSSPSMRNPGRTLARPNIGTGGIGADLGPYIWKFSKEEANSGFGLDQSFPLFRNRYHLNPGGKMGTIDMDPLDKDAKAMGEGDLKGIYLLKDDVLLICSPYTQGSPRPEEFSTTASSKTRLVILRRGQLK